MTNIFLNNSQLLNVRCNYQNVGSIFISDVYAVKILNYGNSVANTEITK